MSIKLSRKPFGDYSLITIGDQNTQVRFVPERSAYIHQIRINGRDLLWNYDSGAELTLNNAYRNPALIPFPNRLLEGKYEWNGKAYEFDINHPESRSALHGFCPDAAFSVDSYGISEVQASVKLTYLHRSEKHQESYPFLIRFEVILEVDIQQQLVSWCLRATNLGSDAAPVGLGWHPYFLLPGGHEQWEIQLPPNKQVVLENAIPTGELIEGLSQRQAKGSLPTQPTPINTHWDDCFLLTDPEKLEVKLLGPVYSLSLKQTGTTRYMQLYVPEGNGSLAVEPMTCGVNAFTFNKDEVELFAGETLSTGMIISLL